MDIQCPFDRRLGLRAGLDDMVLLIVDSRRFEVLTAMKMSMLFLTPCKTCSQILYQLFRGQHCLHFQV
jgi:cytidine deaminase